MKNTLTLVSTRNELKLPVGLYERRGLATRVRERWPTIELAMELPEVLVCFYIIKAEGLRDHWEAVAVRLNIGDREAAQRADRDIREKEEAKRAHRSNGHTDGLEGSGEGLYEGLEGSMFQIKKALKSVYLADVQYAKEAMEIASTYREYAEQLRRTIGHAPKVEVSKRGLKSWLSQRPAPKNKLAKIEEEERMIKFITECLCTENGNPYSFETARTAIAQSDVSDLDQRTAERLDVVFKEWSDGRS